MRYLIEVRAPSHLMWYIVREESAELCDNGVNGSNRWSSFMASTFKSHSGQNLLPWKPVFRSCPVVLKQFLHSKDVHLFFPKYEWQYV